MGTPQRPVHVKRTDLGRKNVVIFCWQKGNSLSMQECHVKEKVPWWCGKDVYLRKVCQQEVRRIKMHVVCF